MKLLCLGTGAADWKIADRADGMEWRRFCSSLLDGRVLVDPGPHVFDYMEKNQCPDLLSGVKDIIVTHSHGDHYQPATVERIARENGGIALWGSFACRDKLIRAFGDAIFETVEFRELHEFENVEIAGYRMLVLPANHSTDIPEEIPFHYAITDGEKSLYYALDGAWLLRSEWNAIRAGGWVFDAIVMDATMGDCPGDFRIFEHNTIGMIEIMQETFRSRKRLRDEGRIYANHMARTLHTDHETLVKRLQPSGIAVCYDGMEIEV